MTMTWPRLLSQARVDASGRVKKREGEAARSQFQRDWDRLIFSHALRRMHDKTQVFPLPEDDVVHSRLTHSLEAASVGRSLAHAAGAVLIERHGLRDVTAADFGAIVSAACLAHDIGNPPFGHAGEDAISEFFRQNSVGQQALQTLTEAERSDLTRFEGNAQGFRTLARLQLEAAGGMRLTAATLATFMKYPRLSGDRAAQEAMAKLPKPLRPELKKQGVHLAERDAFRALCDDVGLLPIEVPGAEAVEAHARHPLAYLVEAADDICYSILDIEDGVRLNLVTAAEAEERLLPIVRRDPHHRETATVRSPRDRVGLLRAVAINQLVNECVEAFLASESALREGREARTLKDVIPSGGELAALNGFAREKCYQSAPVLEIELAGYEAIGGLLEDFVDAVVSAEGKPSTRQKKVLELLRNQSEEESESPEPTRYGRLLRVTDYVSGMTDRYALALYRRVRGISVPGRL